MDGQNTVLRLFLENAESLRSADDTELGAFVKNLIGWRFGFDYKRPDGFAGGLFDSIISSNERFDTYANRGRKGGQVKGGCKATAVRENGLKGGRPIKQENLSKTKAKPKQNLSKT